MKLGNGKGRLRLPFFFLLRCASTGYVVARATETHAKAYATGTLQGVEEFGGFDAAGGELGDELFVGGEKIVLGEFARKNPGDLFEGDWLDGVVGDCGSEENYFESLVAVRIFVLNSPQLN